MENRAGGRYSFNKHLFCVNCLPDAKHWEIQTSLHLKGMQNYIVVESTGIEISRIRRSKSSSSTFSYEVPLKLV